MTFLQEDLLAAVQGSAPLSRKAKAKAPLLPLAQPKSGAKPLKSLPLQRDVMQKATVQEESSHMKTEQPLEKSHGAFKTISEAATSLGVPQHVLRFWESQFSQIKPTKLRGGRRYYRPEDMEVLTKIKHLLYKQGYTIKGARKAFAQGVPVVDTTKKPAPAPRNSLTDKQRSQLTVIRQELIGLREVLKPYVF